MAIFALNQTEIEDGYNNAVANPYIPERDSAPGFFDGSLSAIGTGFERGELEVANLFAPEDTILQDTLNMAKPDPQVTGWLGQQLYALSSAVPAIVGGMVVGGPAGAAALLGASKAYTRAKELKDDGVDETTAMQVGSIEGVVQAAGVMLPAAIPGKVATRVVSGGGMNIALGAGYRGATGKLLEEKGYKDMAAQYRVLDASAMFVDGILGAGFGLLHQGAGKPEVRAEALPSQRDAALAANNIHHFEIESAPGIPADIATRNAHTNAMEVATEQVLRGERVDVSEVFRPEPKAFVDKTPEISQEIIDEVTERIAREHGLESLQVAFLGKKEMELMKIQVTPGEFNQGKGTAALTQLLEFSDKNGLRIVLDPATRGTPYYKGTKSRQTLVDFYKRFGFVENVGKNERKRIQYSMYRNPVTNPVFSDKQIKGNTSFVDKPRDTEANQALDDLRKEYQIAKPKAASAPKAVPKDSVKPAELIPQKTSGDAKEAVEPSAAVTNDIIAEKPDLQISTEDGPLTAKEAIAKADEEIAKAQDDAKLFEAAVNCFIRNGNE